MSDIVTIFPSTGLDIRGSSVGLPLSILHATSIAAKKYDIKIIDQRIDSNWKKTLVKEISLDPLCIAISAMTGSQIIGGIRAAKIIRKSGKDIPIIWGGVHPSLLPRETLESDYADIVVINEGEYTFYELVNKLKQKGDLQKVKGIGYKKKGEIIINQQRDFCNLKSLPEIPYHLINPKEYFLNLYKSSNTLSLQTGRGCPHRCSYCYNKAYHRRFYRAFPTKKIISRIKLYIKWGARSIDLVDDNFFVDKKRVSKFCKAIKDNGIKLNFMTNIRMDYVTKFNIKELKMLRSCGFNEFFIGIESGSDKTLKNINKDLTVEQIIKGNKLLAESGIKSIYSFMGGFPGETKDDLKKTIKLRRRLIQDNPNISLTSIKIFTPFPGSELFDACIKGGFSPPKCLSEWASFNYNTAKYNWGSKRDVKFLEKISFITYFDDKRTAINHFGKNWILKIIVSIYSSIVRLRFKCGFYNFMPEAPLIKFLYKKVGN